MIRKPFGMINLKINLIKALLYLVLFIQNNINDNISFQIFFLTVFNINTNKNNLCLLLLLRNYN